MIGFSPRALLNTSQHFSFPEYILMAAKDKMLHSEGHSASAHSSRHRHRTQGTCTTWPSLVNKTWRPAMTRRLRHKTLSTHRATDRGRRTVEREGQGKIVNVLKSSRRPDFRTHHQEFFNGVVDILRFRSYSPLLPTGKL